MSKHFTPDERTKILETIKNSALPIKDASKAYGISVATYYNWQKKHKDSNLNLGKNILPKKRGPKSIKTLTEEVKKEIIALKEKYPYYGVVKISQYLRRHMGIHVTPTKILRFLREENLPFSESYQPKEQKDPIRFEKSHPNDLWSTDIMSYRIKEDGKFYSIRILDEHCRFTLAHGVFKKATEENVVSEDSQAVE